jgi:hypothetical protein
MGLVERVARTGSNQSVHLDERRIDLGLLGNARPCLALSMPAAIYNESGSDRRGLSPSIFPVSDL